MTHRLWRMGHKIWALAVVLGGCAPPPVVPLQGWLEGHPGWHPATLGQGPWPLAMATRGGQGPLTIYIEGDGHAYVTRDLPSADPTPLDPEGLKLALADGQPGPVVYLARPCQWMGRQPFCHPDLWTTGRFSQAMADAYVNAVAQVSGGQAVTVVGYSGGAWLALQAASRLPNVVKVVTVAGNVDPAYVNALHRVSALDVAPYGPRLATVAQVHYVGEDDKIVPEGVARHYVDTVKPADVRVVAVPGVRHHGWDGVWVGLRGRER